MTERDSLLCHLAQRAVLRHERELVLDDEVASQLAQFGPGDRPAPYLEPCARLLANSVERLQAGDFRLVLAPLNFTMRGAMFGRFLRLLPGLSEPLAACARELAADDTDVVQVMAVTIWPRSANVAQVSRLTSSLVTAGVFADAADPQVLGIDEIAIGAHLDRLYAISLRTGQEILPLLFHANDVRITAPNAVRLLHEISQYHLPTWRLWSWGSAAERLTFLPRLRYGRTILGSARWLLPAELTNATMSWADWERACARWRAEWDIPDRVEAVRDDVALSLDLGSASGLRALREEISGGTVIHEEPLGGHYGTAWAGGMPLRSRFR